MDETADASEGGRLMETAEFLLEVGIEEIPHRMIPAALEDLERRFLAALAEHGLAEQISCRVEGTPRRMTLVADNIPFRQSDKMETLTGPPKSVAFDDKGQPTKAALGFAKRVGVAMEQIVLGDDDRLSVSRSVEGRATVDILSEALPAVILGVSFPKNMYWLAKSGPRYIRPIRWLMALFAGNVVPFEIGGVESGEITHGHRRLGLTSPRARNWSEYEDGLRKNFVLVRAQDRRERIADGIARALPKHARVRPNARLLETLVYLTEWPTPLLGEFDSSYLDLPEEVLETVMLHHQNYFALEDEQGKLQPNFIAVANLDSDPDHTIRRGHERVLRARFNDAQFFWATDQKRTLDERRRDLEAVTFHQKLGSYADKTTRAYLIVKQLAKALGFSQQDSHNAGRAIELAKSDLTTEMVGEFPELQGVMGGLYATAQGEPVDVANAIYDHYRPAGVDDAIPRNAVGQVVAIADKLDTLGGFFRIGMTPTSSKDPYALRRAAYGVIRVLIEGRLPLKLSTLCEAAGAGTNADLLYEFFVERLRYYLGEIEHRKYDEINAVLSASSDEPVDAAARAAAIAEVRPTPNFEPLAVSFKRIENILKKAGDVEAFAGRELDESLLEPGAERDLHNAVEAAKPEIAAFRDRGSYVPALKQIASLRPAVDKFFDEVLVMAKDQNVRDNRLTFLAKLLRELSTIANFAEIVSGESSA